MADTDIFEGLGLPGSPESQATETMEAQGEEISAEQETAPPEPTESERYWQSEADKAKAKVSELEGKVKSWEPVLQRIEKDPGFAKHMLDYLEGAAPKEPELKPPENYDPYDSDANSPSKKYDTAIFAKSIRQQILSELSPILNDVQIFKAETARLQEDLKRQSFSAKHPDLSFDEVMGWARSTSVTEDDLADLYRLRNGKTQSGNIKKVEENANRRGSITSTTGSNPPPKTAAETFLDTIISVGNKGRF